MLLMNCLNDRLANISLIIEQNINGCVCRPLTCPWQTVNDVYHQDDYGIFYWVTRICNCCYCFLWQEKATKWYSEGEIDGLTTNGILIMHPVDGFTSNSKPSTWREVSVDGGLYALRESRSAPQKSSLVSSMFLLNKVFLMENRLCFSCGSGSNMEYPIIARHIVFIIGNIKCKLKSSSFTKSYDQA